MFEFILLDSVERSIYRLREQSINGLNRWRNQNICLSLSPIFLTPVYVTMFVGMLHKL